MREYPSGWQILKIGDKRVCLEIQPGFACGVKDVDGGIPHLRMNNISPDGNADFSLIRRIPRTVADEKNRWLRPGDVLFCNTNSTELVGKTCLFIDWEEPCTFSNHLTRLSANEANVLPEWLTLSIRQLWLAKYFALKCKEFIGQSAFNKDKLREVEIPIPPLDEQRRIVTRIDELTRRADEAQKLVKESVAMLGNVKPSYIYRISKLCDSKGWRKAQLGDKSIASLIMGQSPSGKTYNRNQDGLPLLNGPTEFGEEHPTPIQWTTDSKRECLKGDILFCVRGSTTGRMNWGDQTYSIGRGIAAIRVNERYVPPEFIYEMIQIQVEEILHRAEGGVFPNFNRNQLASLIIPVPPRDEQGKIVEKMRVLKKKSYTVKRIQEGVKEDMAMFQSALLAKAFRGEL